MYCVPEVGDVVTVNFYAYRGESGGTQIVEDACVKCRIIKAWHDYECGWRYWAKPLDAGLPDVIFISQFDVVEV